MTTPYQIGETVDVIYKGVKVTDISELNVSELGVTLDCELGEYRLSVPLGVAEVVRRVPADGMPVPGDLWKDRAGTAWFATDVRDVCETDVPDVRLVCAYEGHTPDRVEQVLHLYGPLTLVYRPEPVKDGGQ